MAQRAPPLSPVPDTGRLHSPSPTVPRPRGRRGAGSRIPQPPKSPAQMPVGTLELRLDGSFTRVPTRTLNVGGHRPQPQTKAEAPSPHPAPRPQFIVPDEVARGHLEIWLSPLGRPRWFCGPLQVTGPREREPLRTSGFGDRPLRAGAVSR